MRRKVSVLGPPPSDSQGGNTASPADGTTDGGALEQVGLPVRAYVINLERSAERRAHMQAQLRKAALDYEIVPAVDGYQMDLLWPQVVKPAEAGQLCSPLWATRYDRPGVAGCSLSHLRAYERIVASAAESALVLEDDVCLARDIAQVVEALSQELSGAEVVLLNFRYGTGTCRVSLRGRKSLLPGRSLAVPVELAGLVSGAGYVITREACERMLEKLTPVRSMSDEWGFFYSLGAIDRLRCVFPMPVRLDPHFPSTVQYDHEPLRALVRTFVLNLRLPLLQQALTWRRRLIWRNGVRVEFVDEAFVAGHSLVAEVPVLSDS